MKFTREEWDNAPSQTWYVERGVKPSQLQEVLNKAKKNMKFILKAKDGTFDIVQSSQKVMAFEFSKLAADPSNRSEWFEL